MLKKISILIIFSFFKFTNGQEICTLKFSNGFSGATIKLLDSNKFQYHSYSCTFKNDESGTYYFDNEVLKLKFIDTECVKLNSRIVSIDSVQNNSNLIKIKFKIIADFDNLPLNNTSITASINSKIVAGNKTDSIGEATLLLNNSKINARIKVSSTGSNSLDIPIFFENHDYFIIINLSEKCWKIHEDGDEILYFIGNETDKFIELSEDGFYYRIYRITCR